MLTLSQAVKYIYDDSNIMGVYAHLGNVEQRVANLYKFLTLCKEYEEGSESNLYKFLTLIENAIYFEVCIPYIPLNIQKSPGNDANSVAWLKPACIQYLVDKNKIKLNSHCKSLCEKLFSLEFQK